MIYEYDRTYEGFLCCIYESYINKEFPIAFYRNEEFPALSLYSVRTVDTIPEHSARILRSISDRSPQAAKLLYRAFFTCMDNKDVQLYRFVQKLYAEGPAFVRKRTDDIAYPLYMAVRHLSGELEKLRGFIRFSDYSGVLGSEIEPKNRVIPFLRHHFCSRNTGESFFIYDRTHGDLLLSNKGCSRIVYASSLELTPPDESETQYRALWKTFFESVSIQERTNPRCQNTHLPKRYRSTMTEFFTASTEHTASPADASLPSVPDAIPAPVIHPTHEPPVLASST